MTRTTSTVPEGRFWEVDFLRGAAIVMMVLFHLLWDINYFGVASVDVYAGFWFYFARATATLFLLVMGVSLTLSAARARLVHTPGAALVRRLVKRGLTILAWGMVITVATRLVLGDGFVIFGILHLAGLSTALAYPFLQLGSWNLALGGGLIVSGLWLQRLTVDVPWFVWLGLKPSTFYTVDYFPLLPWFGVVLIGMAIGDLVYRNYARWITLPNLASLWPVSGVCSLGRHSLAIYLLHQPVLIATLILLGRVNVPALGSP